MRKRKLFIGGGILLVVVAIIFLVVLYDGEESHESVLVTRGTLVEEVDITGTVEPKQEIDLAFEQGGILIALPFHVGDTVKTGDVLARQRNGELLASLREAEAQIKIEEARLSVLEKGTRTQEVNIKEAELKEARANLENLYTESLTLIQDAQNSVDKALNDDVDVLFSNGNANNPQLTFFVTNQGVELEAEAMRFTAGVALFNITTSKNELSSKTISADTALAETILNVREVESFLEKVSEALNATAGVSVTTLATYKADTNTARTSINTVISTIETKIQTIATIKVSIDKLEQGLNLLIEGSREEDIIAQSALLEKAHATKDKINAQITQTILRSPINGVITKINDDLGEIVKVAVPVISVISQGDFEIVVNIPEADIVSVSVGDSARVTLDALSEKEFFTARLVSIDPAQTIIEGVATYKAKLIFLDDRGLVRSGMTANINIETDRKDDVLYVPSRAVLRQEDREYVRVVGKDGIVEERDVVTGIKDVFGSVEIVTGFVEDEEVITFSPES